MIRHGALPDHETTPTCDLIETDGRFTNADAWCLTHDAPVNHDDLCVAAGGPR